MNSAPNPKPQLGEGIYAQTSRPRHTSAPQVVEAHLCNHYYNGQAYLESAAMLAGPAVTEPVPGQTRTPARTPARMAGPGSR